jgi:aryl-alcohol dehydrogenase
MMRIDAAVVNEEGSPFSIEELELDDPGPDEILVRIVATGVCPTDAHVQHQKIPVALPIVLGHEGAGVVERVGESVTAVAPGDHVVLAYQACGHCKRCLLGNGAYCERVLAANFGGVRLDATTESGASTERRRSTRLDRCS